MNRNLLFFIGLFIFALAISGCRSTGQGFPAQVLNQGFAQPNIGGQNAQPILGGIFQQGGAAPTMQQAQEVLSGFGKNLGSRVSNGIVNQGVNRLVSGVFSGL